MFTNLSFPVIPEVTRSRYIKFPNPINRCLWCGKQLISQNIDQRYFSRYFCPRTKEKSSICRTKWLNQYDWRKVRKIVKRRDNWQCVRCKYKRAQSRLLKKNELKILIETNWPKLKRLPKLHVDHIVPVALGGDFWSIENLQTLCEVCHRMKTRTDLVLIKSD